MRRPVLGAALVMMAFLACGGGPTEVDGQFSITGHEPPPFPEPENWRPPMSVAAGPSSITITGAFRGDLCGSDLHPYFQRSDTTLILRVVLRRNQADPTCLQWIITTQFEAVFQDLETAEYSVTATVEYLDFGIGPPRHMELYDLGPVSVDQAAL